MTKWLYFAKSTITPLAFDDPIFHPTGDFSASKLIFLQIKWLISTFKQFWDDYVVFHCTAETFPCTLYQIEIKTKVPWQPSWISKWPLKIEIQKCDHCIYWPPKHIFRYQYYVSMISGGREINKYVFGAPHIRGKFKWRVPNFKWKVDSVSICWFE